MLVTQQFGDATGYNCTAQKRVTSLLFLLWERSQSPQRETVQRSSRRAMNATESNAVNGERLAF